MVEEFCTLYEQAGVHSDSTPRTRLQLSVVGSKYEYKTPVCTNTSNTYQVLLFANREPTPVKNVRAFLVRLRGSSTYQEPRKQVNLSPAQTTWSIPLSLLSLVLRTCGKLVNPGNSLALAGKASGVKSKEALSVFLLGGGTLTLRIFVL